MKLFDFNLSPLDIDRLEVAIKRYFFGFLIGDIKEPLKQKRTNRQNAKYAFGDEDHDYDD